MNKLIWLGASILTIAVTLLAKEPLAKLELKAAAFSFGTAIPDQFTCSGANISPALSWSKPPAGTKSFALILDDPDAPSGDWVHWVVYNLPATLRSLPEDVSKGESIAGGGKQGLNDFPHLGYGGPCPPPGKPHRYFFRLYALDTQLNLRPPVRRKNLDEAMKGHILAQGELMVRFER